MLVRLYRTGLEGLCYAAWREYSGVQDGDGLKYFLTDHPSPSLRTSLGSVFATLSSTGTLISKQRYLPFGAQRTDINGPYASPTDYGYTGQRQLDTGMGGLMDYKARFYSPYINRFLQPDTLIPGVANPQSLNRFSYVSNNPVRFNDPTGHMQENDDDGGCYPCTQLPPPIPDPDRKSEDKDGKEDPENAALDIIADIDDPLVTAAAYAGYWYYINAWKFDRWLYRNIPSAIGITWPPIISLGINSPWGIGGAGDVTQKVYLLNWRSGELDRYTTADAGISFGLPGPSMSIYPSLLLVKGASTNSSWEGNYVSLSAQGYYFAGASVGVSMGLDNNLSPSHDPVSGQNILTLFGGIGAGSPQAGASVTVGTTYMHEQIFDLDLPFSPIPPNNPYLR